MPKEKIHHTRKSNLVHATHTNTQPFNSQIYMAKCCFFLILIVLMLFPSTSSCWLIIPNGCNPGCIQIYQWSSGFASLHIPKFTVQIIVEVWHTKGVYNVQIACPAFASTTMINPMVFRRVGLATCLLRNGEVIKPGEVVTFEYSNILPYPFSVIDMKCV